MNSQSDLSRHPGHDLSRTGSQESQPATTIRSAEATDSYFVWSGESHNLHDTKSECSVSHDSSESSDTDTSTDSYEGDGEIDALSDRLRSSGEIHEADTEHAEPRRDTIETTTLASHELKGISEQEGDSVAFA